MGARDGIILAAVNGGREATMANGTKTEQVAMALCECEFANPCIWPTLADTPREAVRLYKQRGEGPLESKEYFRAMARVAIEAIEALK
jgi:hypothetical protein